MSHSGICTKQIESECRQAVYSLRLKFSIISQSVAAMVLALVFYAKYPNGVIDAFNIFLFSYLSPFSGLEADLITHNLYAVLRGGKNDLL